MVVASAYEDKFQVHFREQVWTERQQAFAAVESIFQQIYDNYVEIETSKRLKGLITPFATKHTTETMLNTFS